MASFGEPITFVLGTSELRAIRVFENGAQKTNLSAISRWVATIAGIAVDSATNPTCFDWTSYRDTDGTSDVLVLSFGALILPIGATSLFLTYYDSGHPLGKQLDNVIPASVTGQASGAAPVALGASLQDGSYSQTIQVAEVLSKGPITNVRAYGAEGSALAEAVADATTANKTLVVSSAETITGNLTIPATRSVQVVKGGSITVDGGTLTVSGAFDAGAFQVFTFVNGGTVAGLTAPKREWFPQTSAGMDALGTLAWRPEAVDGVLPRVKPSKQPLIDLATSLLAGNMWGYGDGTLSVGTDPAYLVYASREDGAGGYLTDARETRIGISTTRATDDIVVDLYLDENYLTHVTPSLLLCESSDLYDLAPPGGDDEVATAAMTDLGNGHYQATALTTDYPTYAYVGVRIRLEPTSTTDREYFVVKQLTLTQGASTLLDTVSLVDGVKWQRNVPKNDLAIYTFHTVPDAGQSVFVAHLGLITGAEQKYVYASPSGIAGNSGSYFNPVDLVTGVTKFNNGSPYLILQAGTYDLSAVQGQNTFLIPETDNKGVIALGPAYIKMGLTVPAASWVSDSDVHKYAYTNTYSHRKAQQDAGECPVLQYSDESFGHTDVASLADCQATEGTRYWNAATGTLYVHFASDTPVDVIIVQNLYFISTDIGGTLDLVNLNVTGSQFGSFLISNKDRLSLFNCSAWGAIPYDNMEFTDCDHVLLVDCSSRYAQLLDGYGFTTTAPYRAAGGISYSEMYDCIGTDNWDNGVSHHTAGCVGYIQGGDFSRSGGSGGGCITPAFGASVTVYKTTIEDAPTGSGVRAISDTGITRARCIECVTGGNPTAYMSTGPSVLEVIRPNYAADDTYVIGNETYSTYDAGWVLTDIANLVRTNFADTTKVVLKEG